MDIERILFSVTMLVSFVNLLKFFTLIVMERKILFPILDNVFLFIFSASFQIYFWYGMIIK